MTDLETALAEFLAEVTGVVNDLAVARMKAEQADRRSMGLEQQVTFLRAENERLNGELDQIRGDRLAGRDPDWWEDC
jgi:hypothetical protein